MHEASWTELHLPAELIAPALARAGIRPAVTGLPEQVIADVMLLTSELVSNALRHTPHSAGDQIIVRIGIDERIRVEVVDSGDVFLPPSPHQRFDTRTSGWGLDLVGAIAGSWGIETDGDGKKVWFELVRE